MSETLLPIPTQPISGTVTANAGTNLNTSLLALESGGNLATLAGTVTSSVLQSNVKQINGITPLMGNGVTGTGSLRVTIASDNTANSNAWLVAGGKTNNNAAPGATNVGSLSVLANAAAPSWTEGNLVTISTDLSGNQRTTLGTLIEGEDQTNHVMKVEEQFTYAHIAAGQATTTVKSGAGLLHSIIFNSAAAATNVTTVYDNTAGSGTVIAIPAATTATIPTSIRYNVKFATGLTIVTATANGADMTIAYR